MRTEDIQIASTARQGTAAGALPSEPVARRRLTPSAVVLLFLVLAAFFVLLFPLVAAAYLSLFADAIIVFPPSSYTFSWYAAAAQYPQFVSSIWLSLQVAFFATIASLLIGCSAAIAVVRYSFPGRALVNMLLLSPLTVPGLVIGLAIFVANVELELATGLPVIGSRFMLAAAHVLITLPWVVRVCAANLATLDRSAEEAAASLGAKPWQVLWRVTLPMMRPGIVAAALFAFVISFENLEMTLFLLPAGEATFPVVILQYLEFRVDPLVAAAVMLQTIAIIILLLIADRLIGLAKIV